ncbi:MAG: 5-deoxy-glucuronate isomerase [Treponema sp.]|jgi:5-deoxy-glucuronate isomerase|nr:5-deoxy-glucuronate isomerase [Treponema sp.]
MEEKKVFGYPAFDESGEMILAAYDNAYRDMLMDIRVYRMKAGEKRSFRQEGEECALLLQSGAVTLRWERNEQTVSRRDVFTQGPWALHVSSGVEIQAECVREGTEILIQRTKNAGRFDSRLYGPADAPWKDVCRGKYGDTANRFVNTLFDYASAPWSNMVLGEVLNDRGNWSGFIPHAHPQPEAYYFLFDRPEGFGASFVGEEVYKSVHRSFSAIPGGKTHPQVCAPGYVMYTCWMIRHLEGNPWTSRVDDERYLWLNDAPALGRSAEAVGKR